MIIGAIATARGKVDKPLLLFLSRLFVSFNRLLNPLLRYASIPLRPRPRGTATARNRRNETDALITKKMERRSNLSIFLVLRQNAGIAPSDAPGTVLKQVLPLYLRPRPICKRSEAKDGFQESEW